MTEENILKLTERWLDAPDQASQILKEAIARDPRSLKLKLRLASIYSFEHGEDVSGAERLYREVLQTDPDNIAALSGLGLLPGYPGVTVSPAERLRLLARAADLSGEPWAMLNLANKAWELGYSSEALAAFTRLQLLAKSKGLDDLVKLAAESIDALQRGAPSRAGQYAWPEI